MLVTFGSIADQRQGSEPDSQDFFVATIADQLYGWKVPASFQNAQETINAGSVWQKSKAHIVGSRNNFVVFCDNVVGEQSSRDIANLLVGKMLSIIQETPLGCAVEVVAMDVNQAWFAEHFR
jgi:hypothetical protein